MNGPDWQKLGLGDGVLAEPGAGAGQVALWVRGGRERGFQRWERVSSVAHGPVTTGGGLCGVAATCLPVRQRVRGLLGRWVRRLRGGRGAPGWVLPDGGTAESCGARETGLALVWAEDEARPADEGRVRSRWPGATRVRKLGRNLFLVAGVGEQGAEEPGEPAQPCPRAAAERGLAEARQAGDPRRLVSALTDLGIALRDADAPRAVALLEEALAVAGQMGDRSAEGDVLAALGSAVLAAGAPVRAAGLFEEALAHARAVGDRFAEKSALNGLGLARAALGESSAAEACFGSALGLARAVGDRQHEARLLWLLGVLHGDLGRADEAAAEARAAADLMARAGDPEAGWYADHAERYRASIGATAVASAWATAPAGLPGRAGVLRMALTATEALARFVGSGLKTVPAEVRQERLRACGACPHHTGLRCRLCGCFTGYKARLAHERCPGGKWGTEDDRVTR